MTHYRRALIPILLILPALACRAATRLVPGLDPGPAANVGTPVAVLAVTASATPVPESSCPDEARLVLYAANSENLPPERFPVVDTGSNVDVPLVTYRVSGDGLSAPMLSEAPSSLMPYQRNFERQRAAWSLFTSLIPAEWRSMVVQFEVMTDGPGGVLSAVQQAEGDPSHWVLQADIADMADTKNLAFNLLHEFAHLLTLGPGQVPPDLGVFNAPDSRSARERAAAACGSYFPGEGCSLPGSYVNAFYGHFWKRLYDEWDTIDQISDQEHRDARLHSFYNKYRDQFVDSYAVTSPVEDVAESWAFFVLSPRPDDERIRDQKLDFFYAYPELVKLRAQVLSGLCAANP